MPLKINFVVFFVGAGIFLIGLLLYVISIFSFAVTEFDKPATGRIYKYSRHPVYLYFLF